MKITYEQKTPLGNFKQLSQVKTLACAAIQFVGSLIYCYNHSGYVAKVIDNEDIINIEY